MSSDRGEAILNQLQRVSAERGASLVSRCTALTATLPCNLAASSEAAEKEALLV